MNKNVANASLITFCIALLVAWFLWGNTTDHIWSSWLFLVLIIVDIMILASILADSLRNNIFNTSVLMNVVGIVVFGLLFIGTISNIRSFYLPNTWVTILSVISYIIDGALALLLIFTGVRFLQEAGSQ